MAPASQTGLTRSREQREEPDGIHHVEHHKRIQTARLQAGRAVNRELVMLYWDIGRDIVERLRDLKGTDEPRRSCDG